MGLLERMSSPRRDLDTFFNYSLRFGQVGLMNEVPFPRSAFHFVSGSVCDAMKRDNYLRPTLEVIVMMHAKSLFLGFLDPRQ